MTRTALVYITLIVASASIALGDVIILDQPAVRLSRLVSGGGALEVGDKTFTNFFYSGSGDMPAADDINVIPIQSDGNYGLRFQGGFIDLPGGSASDSLITFTVSVTDTNRLISDAHLAGNVDLLGDGFGLGSVTETFLPDFPMQMLTIYDNGSDVQLSDWLDFPTPVSSVDVQKNIVLFAGQGSAGATMSFVDQTFSQVLVPEPAEVGLLLVAAAGLLALRIRR